MKGCVIGVLGSGPAGLAAAMSLARANVKTVVFAGDKFGGQIIDAVKINNCPGFEHNISGQKMIDILYDQAVYYGAEMVNKTVTKVNFNTNPFIVSTSDGDEKFFDGEKLLVYDESKKLIGIYISKENFLQPIIMFSGVN